MPPVRIEHDDPYALCTRTGWEAYQERAARWRAGEHVQVTERYDYVEERKAPGA